MKTIAFFILVSRTEIYKNLRHVVSGGKYQKIYDTDSSKCWDFTLSG